ncbi:MAG: gephyrin-like molybdotransferase Glp [Roseimicrobium sp.]
MLTEHAAQARILEKIVPLPTRLAPLTAALHGYAAHAIHAMVPLPRFDHSAMDGYALRAVDSDNRPLAIVGTIPAGKRSETTLMPGQAMRIFTGAPMPPGADAVIMQEDVKVLDEGRQITCTEPVVTGENVRKLGCDLCVGQRVISKGDRLTPARLAAIAAQGIAKTEIAAPPRIAILTTGDELIPPGQLLQPGCLFNSNGTLLATLVKELCSTAAIEHEHVPDDLARTMDALERLTRECDFLILSGGVSVGEHDFTKPALQSLRIAAEFWRVKVKPGKPFLFAETQGTERRCHIFGLPGNPVSAFVTFQLFVRPALLKALGASEGYWPLPQSPVQLRSPIANEGDRPHYVRGRCHDGIFEPLGMQQSHALFGLSCANALLRLEPGQTLSPGDRATALICSR